MCSTHLKMSNLSIEWTVCLLLTLFIADLSGDNKSMVLEDAHLNFTELSNKYGQNCEENDVITDDGYILKVFHIPGDRTRPVLLVSGNMGTADEYIVRGNTSLAITLAEANYDVWAGNMRGCKYGRRHILLDPDNDKAFWNFSYHEYSVYDSASLIDYILEKTKQTQVTVISLSLGTTQFYILGAERPEYNEKVKLLICMAPISYVIHSVPMSIVNSFAPLIDQILPGQEEINGENSINIILLRRICATPWSAYNVCVRLSFFATGDDVEEIEPGFAPIPFGHFPSSTSRKNVMHLSQLATSRRFPKFDYGIDENILKYGSEFPPDYNLSAVTMKVALISGKNDWISTLKDVELLKAKLPNVVDHIVLKPKKFNHVDFVLGRNTHKILFPYIFRLLKSKTSKNS